jgi:hypothetical protein
VAPDAGAGSSGSNFAGGNAAASAAAAAQRKETSSSLRLHLPVQHHVDGISNDHEMEDVATSPAGASLARAQVPTCAGAGQHLLSGSFRGGDAMRPWSASTAAIGKTP